MRVSRLYSATPRLGVIERIHEGFTPSQASYGVSQAY